MIQSENTERESSFFSGFMDLFNNCIEWIGLMYGREQADEPARSERMESLHELIDFTFMCFCSDIQKDLFTFPYVGLFAEIESNLDQLHDGEETARYIHKLLLPFARYSEIFHTETGGQSKTVKCCMEALEGAGEIDIKTAGEDLLWAKFKTFAVEDVLKAVMRVEQRYANVIDSMLLERGIDLIDYQERYGIYIQENRDNEELVRCVGNRKLLGRLVREAGQKQGGTAQLQSSKVELPSELDTTRARKLFQRALDKDFMERTADGYRWKLEPAVFSLAAFVELVYCPKHKGRLKQKELCKLFGVKETLSSAIYRIKGSSMEQEWLREINDLDND